MHPPALGFSLILPSGNRFYNAPFSFSPPPPRGEETPNPVNNPNLMAILGFIPLFSLLFSLFQFTGAAFVFTLSLKLLKLLKHHFSEMSCPETRCRLPCYHIRRSKNLG